MNTLNDSLNAQYNKVLLWEKGFAKYIEACDKIGYGRGNAHLNRKLNDGIRMMAIADYDGMVEVVNNPWLIRRALKNIDFNELIRSISHV
jgi:hypothetical protein